MVYTPQFSEKSSNTIRRLSWALGVPMTKVVELIFNELALIFSPLDICPKCKDKSECNLCAFGNQPTIKKEEPAA
jgi:hypothetical protein